uniref:Uncharacterized protein AlNc14C1G35 n=1 Tax=Albugo laibachii Nc14 TaxID=890382 RepID=F0VYN3_9STRA|nr:conserved hypothetical protein [Albugo laibachii Nc14]|eukprot:CCA13897.1 conserved hypothetical protein [Albugo laibachii Nc14]
MLGNLHRLSRCAPALSSRTRHNRCAYSIWDRVHPSFWHPMVSMEQSLMEFDRLANQLLDFRPPATGMFVNPSPPDDDEFFGDILPQSSKKEAKSEQSPRPQKGDDSDLAYSSYSYSNSTVVDDSGRKVSSVRRRYEDSAGRMKAIHERVIGDKKVKAVWKRKSKNEKGDQHTFLSGAEMDEFEKEWKQTVFGKAEEESRISSDSASTKKVEEPNFSDSMKENVHRDEEAVQTAPKKDHTKESEGVTEEAKMRSREDAISRGSMNQESETTPHQHNH